MDLVRKVVGGLKFWDNQLKVICAFKNNLSSNANPFVG